MPRTGVNCDWRPRTWPSCDPVIPFIIILSVAVLVLTWTVWIQTQRMNRLTERVIELDKLVATLIISQKRD